MEEKEAEKERIAKEEEARARQVYDPISKTLNFTKKRATDCVSNTHGRNKRTFLMIFLLKNPQIIHFRKMA